MICKICNVEQDKLYAPSRGLCKKCYQAEYFKDYYKNNSEKIKDTAKKHYQDHRDDKLKAMKDYREAKQFDSQRMRVIIRDDYTCQTCKKQFEESQLVVHHKDRKGRGSKVKNNSDENLTTSCRGCHAKEHSEELQAARKAKYASRWAKNYDNCVQCGTTERKHQGKGLCVNCHAKHLRSKQMKI